MPWFFSTPALIGLSVPMKELGQVHMYSSIRLVMKTRDPGASTLPLQPTVVVPGWIPGQHNPSLIITTNFLHHARMDPTGRRTRSQTNSPGRRITRKSNVRAKDSMDALSSASSEAERTLRTRRGRDVQRSDRDVPDVRSTRGNTGKGGRAIRNASVALAEATNTSATPRREFLGSLF